MYIFLVFALSYARHPSRKKNTDKWWSKRKNKFSRCVSSSCKIKLNKRDCGEKKICVSAKRKNQNNQTHFSHVRRRLTFHPHDLYGATCCVRRVDSHFSAAEMFFFLPLHFPRVFHFCYYSHILSLHIPPCGFERNLIFSPFRVPFAICSQSGRRNLQISSR